MIFVSKLSRIRPKPSEISVEIIWTSFKCIISFVLLDEFERNDENPVIILKKPHAILGILGQQRKSSHFSRAPPAWPARGLSGDDKTSVAFGRGDDERSGRRFDKSSARDDYSRSRKTQAPARGTKVHRNWTWSCSENRGRSFGKRLIRNPRSTNSCSHARGLAGLSSNINHIFASWESHEWHLSSPEGDVLFLNVMT